MRFLPSSPEQMSTVLKELRPSLETYQIEIIAPTPKARPRHWTLRYVGTEEERLAELGQASPVRPGSTMR
jgi:hypothetical protein